MNTVLPSLMVLLRKPRRSLVYASMAALTAGLEGLFESIVFNCPCEGHYAYGLAFLWAPALLLFLAGFLVDRDLWRHPRRAKEKQEKTTLARRYFQALLATLDVLIRAGIAPVAWLVLSFLQQQYYTCAYFGPPIDSDDNTMSNTTYKCHFELGSRYRALEESYKIRSQIAGWSLMLTAMSVLFTSVCIRRCIQKGKHLRIPSLEYYHHVEAKAALQHFHAKAEELVKGNAKKEIHLLFVKATSKDFNSRLQDVEKGIANKYEPFFEIPPESPSYISPVSATRDPPQFPASATIARVLLADGFEMNSLEVQKSVCVNSAQCSSQTYQAPEHTSNLTRVRLYRQESFDASRK